jgi:putative transposase
VLLICKLTKLVLGRPWLTLAIDRKSRMIVGFYISFHAPSAYSVLYCLRMAIMPKDHILKRFKGIRGRWPARGIPDLVVSDNGMELHAESIEVVTYELGIEHQYCGVADPEMKGAIERLFRTVNMDLFHQLPGTVFSNPRHRADYPSEKLACLDLETFIEILVRWIVDIYHNTPHRALNGYTPQQVWEADEANRVIELPAYPEQLETIVAIATERTVFHYGIAVDNLFYNSVQLQTLFCAAEEKLVLPVRHHEHDVGYIHVQDPGTREFFKVPAVKQDYAAGLNRHVHLLVCAEARHRFGDGWRDEELLEVKAEIQAIVEAAIRDKKMSTRKGAAVAAALDSEAVISPNVDEMAEALDAAQRPIRLDAPPPVQAPPDVANDDLPDLVATEVAA